MSDRNDDRRTNGEANRDENALLPCDLPSDREQIASTFRTASGHTGLNREHGNRTDNGSI